MSSSSLSSSDYEPQEARLSWHGKTISVAIFQLNPQGAKILMGHFESLENGTLQRQLLHLNLSFLDKYRHELIKLALPVRIVNVDTVPMPGRTLYAVELQLSRDAPAEYLSILAKRNDAMKAGGPKILMDDSPLESYIQAGHASIPFKLIALAEHHCHVKIDSGAERLKDTPLTMIIKETISGAVHEFHGTLYAAGSRGANTCIRFDPTGQVKNFGTSLETVRRLLDSNLL